MLYLLTYLAIGAVNVALLAVDRIRCGQWSDPDALTLSLVEVAFWLLAWPIQFAFALYVRAILPIADWATRRIGG